MDDRDFKLVKWLGWLIISLPALISAFSPGWWVYCDVMFYVYLAIMTLGVGLLVPFFILPSTLTLFKWWAKNPAGLLRFVSQTATRPIWGFVSICLFNVGVWFFHGELPLFWRVVALIGIPFFAALQVKCAVVGMTMINALKEVAKKASPAEVFGADDSVTASWGGELKKKPGG